MKIIGTKRMVSLLAKSNASTSNANELISDDGETHNNYLQTDSTDEDCSIAYIEDYSVTENGSDTEEGFFVEYINDVDENYQIADDINEIENESLTEYVDADDSDDLYNCNLCGMNFKSITEHIEQYHSDQDVVIDVLDENGLPIKGEGSIEMDEENLIDDADSSNAMGDEIIVYGDDGTGTDGESASLDEYVLDFDCDTSTVTRSAPTTTITPNKTSKQTTIVANKKVNFIFFYFDFIFLLIKSFG